VDGALNTWVYEWHMAIPSTARARLGMSAVDRQPHYAVAGASLAEAVEVVEWTADIATLRSTL
jgi:hypothetical protein